jgi:hypothetical protein
MSMKWTFFHAQSTAIGSDLQKQTKKWTYKKRLHISLSSIVDDIKITRYVGDVRIEGKETRLLGKGVIERCTSAQKYQCNLLKYLATVCKVRDVFRARWPMSTVWI